MWIFEVERHNIVFSCKMFSNNLFYLSVLQLQKLFLFINFIYLFILQCIIAHT